jgi:hypothetical protein
MPDVDRDGIDSGPERVRGLAAGRKRLEKILRREPIRGTVYFLLGAITAGIVFLGWTDENPADPRDSVTWKRSTAEVVNPVSTARAATPGERQIFHWRSADGGAYRALVDGDRYQTHASGEIERLDKIRADQIVETDKLLRADLRPVLDGVEKRVTDYGDWMYNWWTAWILLGQAFGWTWQGILDGDILKLPDAVQAQLTLEIRQQYNSIVLRPEVLEPQMQALLDRAVGGVQREILQICGRNNALLSRYIRDEAREVERLDPRQGWTPVAAPADAVADVASTCGFLGAEEGNRLVGELMATKPMSNLDAGVNEVIVRLSRPFATKLVSFMVLPVVATALAGGVAIPIVGFPAGVLAGLLTGGAVSALVVGFSTSAAVDWILTRTDEAFSRQTFEGNLRKAVTTAADDFESRVADAVERYVNRQYLKIATTMAGRESQP